jgi:hypothetical protein
VFGQADAMHYEYAVQGFRGIDAPLPLRSRAVAAASNNARVDEPGDDDGDNKSNDENENDNANDASNNDGEDEDDEADSSSEARRAVFGDNEQTGSTGIVASVDSNRRYRTCVCVSHARV